MDETMRRKIEEMEKDAQGYLDDIKKTIPIIDDPMKILNTFVQLPKLYDSTRSQVLKHIEESETLTKEDIDSGILKNTIVSIILNKT